MVQNLELHGVHTNIDDKLRKHIEHKIGGLDKYVSLSARRSLHIEVFAKQSKKHTSDQFECELIAHLPKTTIRIHEQASSMQAAVDVVESKMKQALIRYKDMHGSPKRWRHLLKRNKGQA